MITTATKTTEITLVLKDLSSKKTTIEYKTRLPRHITWEEKLFLLNLDMGPVFYEEIDVVNLREIEIV